MQIAGVAVRDVEALVLEELANRNIVIDGDNFEKVALCFPLDTFKFDQKYKGGAVS